MERARSMQSRHLAAARITLDPSYLVLVIPAPPNHARNIDVVVRSPDDAAVGGVTGRGNNPCVPRVTKPRVAGFRGAGSFVDFRNAACHGISLTERDDVIGPSGNQTWLKIELVYVLRQRCAQNSPGNRGPLCVEIPVVDVQVTEFRVRDQRSGHVTWDESSATVVNRQNFLVVPALYREHSTLGLWQRWVGGVARRLRQWSGSDFAPCTQATNADVF